MRHGWHNTLPDWILADDSYKQLRAGPRATLQAIADLCDGPDEKGNLMVAFGGINLAQAAGVSMRAMWRHINRLEQSGFIVTLGRGGAIGGRNYGNQYAVPSIHGALDGRRIAREQRRMTLCDNNTYRPEVILAGEPAVRRLRKVTKVGITPVTKCHDPRDKMTRPPCQNDTPPSHIPSPPLCKNHGAFSPRKSQVNIPHVRVRVFEDTAVLIELYESCVQRGAIEKSEASLQAFAALAAHAVRVGKNPAALFAYNLRAGKWATISNEDDDVAAKRLRAHRATDFPSKAAAGRPLKKPAAAPIDRDAIAVKKAMAAAERQHGGLDGPGLARLAFYLINKADSSWHRERFNAALKRRTA